MNCFQHIPGSCGALHSPCGEAPQQRGPLTPQTQTRPNRLHTHTHPPKRLAHPRLPLPPLSTLTSRATHAHPTSPRSTGFCAIWGCISSISSVVLLHLVYLCASVPYGVVLVRVRHAQQLWRVQLAGVEFRNAQRCRTETPAAQRCSVVLWRRLVARRRGRVLLVVFQPLTFILALRPASLTKASSPRA